MSAPSQDELSIQAIQGEHRRIIVPLRLIFWGIVIHLVGFRIGGFELVNASILDRMRYLQLRT